MPRNKKSPIYEEYSYKKLKDKHLKPTNEALGKVGNGYKVVKADDPRASHQIFKDQEGNRYLGSATGFEHPLDKGNRQRFMKENNILPDPVAVSMHRGNLNGLEELVGREDRNYTERHVNYTETGRHRNQGEISNKINRAAANLRYNTGALDGEEPFYVDKGRALNEVRERDRNAYHRTGKALWKMILAAITIGFGINYLFSKPDLQKSKVHEVYAASGPGYSEQLVVKAGAKPSALELSIGADYTAGNNAEKVRDYLSEHEDQFLFIENNKNWYIHETAAGKTFQVPKKCSLEDYVSSGDTKIIREYNTDFEAYLGSCSTQQAGTPIVEKGAYALLAVPVMLGTLGIVAGRKK